ncbi:MAG: response regulator, partial [Methanospirillum sp.]|uniref:response regulator n=1 Tax=Methanospirillum sp. TaxID=45200 RepID=UPI00237351BF
PMICDVTRLCLERGGRFKVDVVHTAEEALACLQKSSYSCVISDYEMPSMNGLELLKEVRRLDPDIPFIFFSGRGRENVVIEAINTGADFYIQKGGDTKTLFAELNHKVDYAITKRNSRLALKRRDAILETVSLVASLFLGGESFKKALKESLTLFGLATEVDMVLIFREDPTGSNYHSYYRLCGWSRLGDPEPAEGLVLEPGIGSVWEDRIQAGMNVVGSSHLFSDGSQGFLHDAGVRSIAAFPIIADREVRGMIWFCDCLSEREWAIVEVDALQAASSIIGSALHHEEMHSALLAGKENYESMYSLMRQLCDTVPDMLWAKDLEGRYIFVNRETSKRLLGSSDTQEPIGRTEAYYLTQPVDSGLVHLYPGTGCESSHPSRQSVQEVPSISETTIMEDEKRVHLTVKTVPFFDQNKELIGSVTVGRDITAERDAATALRLERQKYAGIFHQIHIGLITCGPGGEISEHNQRAAELLGIAGKKMCGMNLHSIPGLGDTGLLRDLSVAQVHKAPIHGRSEYCTATGIKKSFYYSIQPRYDDDSRVLDVLLTIDEHYHS